MELTPTSYVVLGMLANGPQSGYDIKQLADISTRHFWAISYGQIYPELKRLVKAGLVKAEDASRGTRPRTIHHLTAKGRQVFNAWVTDTEVRKLEIRDEMLLKLFFSDASTRKDTVRLLAAMSERHMQTAAALRANEPMAASRDHRMKYEVLKFGVGLHTWCADFYSSLAKDLDRVRETKR
ncbi:MAG TPA: PadR family transcriptional regulator [Candidatus Dormibacteraeota bacterium]